MTAKDSVGTLLLVGVTSVLIVMGVVLFGELNRTRIDSETFCPIDAVVSRTTVMLIDRTDPLNVQHISKVHRVIEDIKATLQVGERFSIFFIEAQTTPIPVPVFTICKPPTGAQTNRFTRNQSFADKRYRERFEEPLSELLVALETPVRETQSPILETISTVSNLPSFVSAIEVRKLIIVSDFLQNTEGFSHYQNSVDYETFRSSSYARLVQADLKRVAVNMVYLDRLESNAQSQLHELFWYAYFKDAGAIASNGGRRD